MSTAGIMKEVDLNSQSDPEKQRTRVGSAVETEKLDAALESLDISEQDADEAFAYLRDHPDADSVRQEAIAILSDPVRTKKLLRKIDFTIVPCMVAVYFLQFLWVVKLLGN